MQNLANLFEDNNNAILRKIEQYDNIGIIDADIEMIASNIARECFIPEKLELDTNNLAARTYMTEIPTRDLPPTMRIGARKPSYQFAATDYHIKGIGNTYLLKFLPIMSKNNVKMDGDTITLTLTINYVSLNLPDEKIEECKRSLKSWLQEAKQEISDLLSEIKSYNTTLKADIISMLEEIQRKQQRLKEQNDKLSQID